MKKAFTLAEGLITMLVLGILMSLTIPNIFVDLHGRSYKTGWRVVYGDLEESHKNILMKRNIQTIANEFADENELMDAYKESFNIISECSNPNECWADGVAPANTSSVMLTNGAVISMEHSTCTNSSQICGTVTIDVNGANQPNAEGADILKAYIMPSYIKPFGVDDSFKGVCPGLGCSALYLVED